MVDRFSSVQRLLIRVCLGWAIIVTSSCTVTPVSANTFTLPACNTSKVNRNPYQIYQSPHHYIEEIFVDYRDNSLLNTKQDALMQLGKSMKHWSDYKNITNGDKPMIRVSITYLDPVLVQYIILNNVLSKGQLNEVNINTTINDEMGKLAQRDRLLFLVTITSPIYSEQAYGGINLNVKVPIENLVLVNSSGMKTIPLNYDHILTENIDISQGPVYGIVGYPVSVVSGENCVAFIDQWTTSFTLDLDSISLSNKPSDPLFWYIPYQPLITQTEEHLIPNIDQSYNGRLEKNGKPPVPNMISNAVLDETSSRYYWEEMGRYFWYILIGESGH